MIATTDGKIWHPAPESIGPCQTGDIQGVNLFPDEEVEWVYSGNRVTGYTIKKKIAGQNNTK